MSRLAAVTGRLLVVLLLAAGRSCAGVTITVAVKDAITARPDKVPTRP